MTAEESKAVSFVAILLVLGLVARSLSKPRPMEVHAGAVDLAALQAETEAMQQAPHRKSRGKRAVVTQETAPAAPAQPWTEPAWRRPHAAPVLIDDTRPAAGPAGKIDLNSATARQIESLPGVGPSMAQRIVARRDSIHRFEKIEDLDPIKGIGPALIDRLRPLVVLR